MCQQSFDSDDEDEYEDGDDEDDDFGANDNESNRARHHNTKGKPNGVHGNLETNEDEEEAESSLVLLEAVAEALPALATVVGAQPFASEFEPHFQAILKRAHPSRSGARTLCHLRFTRRHC